MRKNINLKCIIKNVRANWIHIVYASMIFLIIGSCASGHSKQELTDGTETFQASEKGESKNGKTNDGKEIECRRITVTGSRLGDKVCAKKEVWAVIDKKREETANKVMDEFHDNDRQNEDVPEDALAPF